MGARSALDQLDFAAGYAVVHRMGCEQHVLDRGQRGIFARMGGLLSAPPARRAVQARRRRNERSAWDGTSGVESGWLGLERFAVFGASGGSDQVCRVSSQEAKRARSRAGEIRTAVETVAVGRVAEATR